MKRLLIPLLVAMIFSSSMVVQAQEAGIFLDTKEGDKNFDAIKYLKEQKVVQGYSDGNFRAKNKINRAEFLKIVMESAGIFPEGKGNCYKDVTEDAWYSAYVCTATKQGLINGYADGKFRPEREINFAEASKIVVASLNLVIPAVQSDTWYEQYITTLEDQDAIPDTISSFDHKLTRGEMAEIVWRVKVKPSYNIKFITYNTIERRMVAAETGGKLQRFDSCLELKEHLEDSSKISYKAYDKYMMDEMTTGAEEEDGDDDVAAEPVSEAKFDMASAKDDGGEVDYSTTNVQVEGVDEADIVKTDGKYIYLVKGESVRVVKAYPATEMKELSRITVEDESFYPQDMYIDNERLVVTGYSYNSIMEDMYVKDKIDSIYPNYGQITKVYIFDLKDKENISLLRQLSFQGDYSSSRKVDQMVYLVVNKPEYNYVFDAKWGEEDILPLYSDSSTDKVEPVTGCNKVLYFPAVESTNYVVVAGIPIDDPKADIVEEVVLGTSGNIYASRQNLYIAEEQYDWWGWWEGGNEDEDETVIHKFNLGRTDIKYSGKSEVPGHILNQFSMDEYLGNFRIATTTGEVWDAEEPSKNNVYVLDENLKITGRLEGVAPGEKIYSVRFMGAKAYMVTFKKVDPFFVLDLSDPKSPKILGKLKIPGYSDYLHPFDENHIIGFGKEAIDASSEEVENKNLNFAWYQGVKVAMFDVTDVSNPVELHKILIGDRGTDSPLLWDHKALMFSKGKGLMAFPITLAEISENVKNDPNTPDYTYGDYVYQGAYVYDVSVEKGFNLRGRITHYDENEVDNLSGYYWSGDKDIDRILYIGDYLYTVSMAIVKANNLGDLVEVNEVKLLE